MQCLACGLNNQRDATSCANCGAELSAARASYYLNLASTDVEQGDYVSVAANLAKADGVIVGVSLAQQAQHLLTARAAWVQGCLYSSQGLNAVAQDEFMKVYDQLTGRPMGIALLANTCNRLGNLSFYQGARSNSINYYEQSAELAVQAGDHVIAARAYNNLGNMYANQGKIAEAEIYYKQALAQAKLSDNPTSLAQTYRVLAWMYSQYGPYSIALEYCKAVLGLYNQVSSLFARCQILNDVGATYLRHMDYLQAELYLREAYSLVRKLNNKTVEMSIAISLAELMQQTGADEAWLAYCVRAFNDASDSSSLRREAAVKLAVYYIEHNSLAKARRHLDWLIEVSTSNQEVNNEELAWLYRAEGMYAAALGDWDRMIQQFEAAIQLAPFSRYELAVTWFEYGRLLHRQASTMPTANHAAAQAALEQAADLYQQLELPKQREVALALSASLGGLSQPAPVDQQARAVLH